jgi:hypothetical protein
LLALLGAHPIIHVSSEPKYQTIENHIFLLYKKDGKKTDFLFKDMFLSPTNVVLNIYWRLKRTNLALKKLNFERRSDSGNELFNFAGCLLADICLKYTYFLIFFILHVYVFKLRLRSSKQSLACQWCCAYGNLRNHAVVPYFIIFISLRYTWISWKYFMHHTKSLEQKPF